MWVDEGSHVGGDDYMMKWIMSTNQFVSKHKIIFTVMNVFLPLDILCWWRNSLKLLGKKAISGNHCESAPSLDGHKLALALSKIPNISVTLIPDIISMPSRRE